VTPTVDVSDTTRHILTGLFIVFGLGMLIAGALSFRFDKTTVNPLKPEQASSLVKTGVCRVSRNPMYVGFASILEAWTSYLGSFWSLALVAGYIAYIHVLQVKPEERAMRKLFGHKFETYTSHVRPWL
jgi:protein-S-isoprenylcysteine O-methyltransferase Ste14